MHQGFIHTKADYMIIQNSMYACGVDDSKDEQNN